MVNLTYSPATSYFLNQSRNASVAGAITLPFFAGMLQGSDTTGTSHTLESVISFFIPHIGLLPSDRGERRECLGIHPEKSIERSHLAHLLLADIELISYGMGLGVGYLLNH